MRHGYPPIDKPAADGRCEPIVTTDPPGVKSLPAGVFSGDMGGQFVYTRRMVITIDRPAGAIVTDTSDMDINQVTEAMVRTIEERT